MPMSGKEMLKVFIAAGWIKKNQVGSHVKVEKDSQIAIIPMHRELKKGTEYGLLKRLKEVK